MNIPSSNTRLGKNFGAVGLEQANSTRGLINYRSRVRGRPPGAAADNLIRDSQR